MVRFGWLLAGLLGILASRDWPLALGSDALYPNVTVNRLVFGSCNRQWLDQGIFDTIADQKPDIFVLGGDAFYTGPSQFKSGEKAWATNSREAILHAIKSTKSSKPLQRLKSVVRSPFIGTYDDHDRGFNDGGSGVYGPGIISLLGLHGGIDREERKNLFLDFLDVPEESHLRNRAGLYSSHLYGSDSRTVKVILLDTRYFRDDLIIPSIGHISFISVLSVFCRILAGLTGLSLLNDGNILGEDQWYWLEKELQHSQFNDVDVNIIVSSIQVFTSNPAFESWGHFPEEKARFIKLLREYDPNGLAILSGDVHFGEFSSLQHDLKPIEFTSSGLTHNCSDGFIPKWICELEVGFFSSHRPHPKSFFLDKNFLVIDIQWKDSIEAKSSQEDSEQLERGHGCGFDYLKISLKNQYGQSVLSSLRDSCRSMGNILPVKATGTSAFVSIFGRLFFIGSIVLTISSALVFLISRSKLYFKQKRH